MAALPILTATLMDPVTGNPYPTRVRGLSPVTTDGNISPATGFPLLIDPHMPRARSHRAGNRMPCRSYRNINLGGSRHSSGAHHQNHKKCQFYNFTFTHAHDRFFRGVRDYFVIHMLVFKFDVGLFTGQQVKRSSRFLTVSFQHLVLSVYSLTDFNQKLSPGKCRGLNI